MLHADTAELRSLGRIIGLKFTEVEGTFMVGLRHSCGVVAMVATCDVVSTLRKALLVIQHRGQESAGISVFDGKTVKTIKSSGLVFTALNDYNIKDLAGNCGIGHVRYSTTGSEKSINAQPQTTESKLGTIAVAHNGSITNFSKLRKKCRDQGMSFLTDSDSEMIAKIISKYITQLGDIVGAIKATMNDLEGAFSLTIMINDRVFGLRDPYGFRPLCIGKFDNAYMIVSESAALDTLHGEFVRDVDPGEIIEITSNVLTSYPPKNSTPRAHCMFEWVYFARPESIIECREVYSVRKKIGMILAKESPVNADLVMPVPDSGRAHALGFSIGSGIQYEEGFIKNRFVERTFILPNQKDRENAVSMKMNPVRSTVDGKCVVVVDDSIVRGTTIKLLITMLREAGAREIHVRVGCPPVISPCYYGVDMTSRDQFIANFYDTKEICDMIGADSLKYISIGGLIDALGILEKDLCLACVNNKYPTRIDGEKYRLD